MADFLIPQDAQTFEREALDREDLLLLMREGLEPFATRLGGLGLLDVVSTVVIDGFRGSKNRDWWFKGFRGSSVLRSRRFPTEETVINVSNI